MFSDNICIFVSLSKKYPLSETVIYLKRFILAYNISAQFVDSVYR